MIKQAIWDKTARDFWVYLSSGGRGLGCGTRVKLTTGSGLWVMRLASENIRSNEADTCVIVYLRWEAQICGICYRASFGSHKIVLEVQWKATGKCQGAPGINLSRWLTSFRCISARDRPLCGQLIEYFYKVGILSWPVKRRYRVSFKRLLVSRLEVEIPEHSDNQVDTRKPELCAGCIPYRVY